MRLAHEPMMDMFLHLLSPALSPRTHTLCPSMVAPHFLTAQTTTPSPLARRHLQAAAAAAAAAPASSPDVPVSQEVRGSGAAAAKSTKAGSTKTPGTSGKKTSAAAAVAPLDPQAQLAIAAVDEAVARLPPQSEVRFSALAEGQDAMGNEGIPPPRHGEKVGVWGVCLVCGDV